MKNHPNGSVGVQDIKIKAWIKARKKMALYTWHSQDTDPNPSVFLRYIGMRYL